MSNGGGDPVKALVIGGSGPTGPHVLQGLLDRGYDVTMLHRGVHEPHDLPDVRHLHADPHFAEPLLAAIGERSFDLIVAMYGRVKAIAAVAAPRCGHFVAITGVPVYRGLVDPQHSSPYGMKLDAREDSPKADTAAVQSRTSILILDAERAAFDEGAAHGIAVSALRYPQIYGPRNIVPWEWPVVRRVLDGRRQIIVPDDGLWIISRCAARNAAAAVLSIVDRPDVSAGEAYNCADADQFTLRQWVQLVAQFAGGELEVVGIPAAVARSHFIELLPPGARPHLLVNAEKLRHDLGYVEVVNAYDALRDTVTWMIENPITPADYPTYAAKFDYALDDLMIEKYRLAVAQLNRDVPDHPPEVKHPMPHPRVSALTVDERGR
jgi:nucleoside-diphosphate-sugar epimerase